MTEKEKMIEKMKTNRTPFRYLTGVEQELLQSNMRIWEEGK
jgi:hypothetical protein